MPASGLIAESCTWRHLGCQPLKPGSLVGEPHFGNFSTSALVSRCDELPECERNGLALLGGEYGLVASRLSRQANERDAKRDAKWCGRSGTQRSTCHDAKP
ncbi:hypothetical protein Cs7R123_26230 [Catellatospora sp. TT07R-123]|nr:hypothetical protein Cs7R123_26230 [Catellatospora sp. TT07R-123]